MADLEGNKAIVRAFFEHLGAGPADALLALYADSFTCWTAGSLPFSGGKTYHQRDHFLFFVRGGKIQEMREYFDTMHANDVLCSVPAPGFTD
jgi:pentatricopeptide repeat protein